MKTYTVTATKRNRPVVKRFTVLYKEGIEGTLISVAKRLGLDNIVIVEVG